MSVRLAVLGVIVADMATSLNFYRELGLDLPPELDAEDHVECLLPGGLTMAWDTSGIIKAIDPAWTPQGEGHSSSIAFACDSAAEVDALYARLAGLGPYAYVAPWDAFWVQRYAVLHDPDRNAVDLFASLPPSHD